MSKKFFFLAGLPRSGNTLISSILNQNPDIQVAPNSPLPEILWSLNQIHNHENLIRFPDHNSLDSFISSSFECYYQNWSGKYIIDRAPWGTPGNLELLEKYLNQDIKIIVTVRDIVEILASFVRLNPTKMLSEIYQREIDMGYRFNMTYKSQEETICELLMSPYAILQKCLFSLLNLLKEENKQYLHLLEYTDLIEQPEKSIQEIYNFLEIPYYKKHDFNSISEYQVNNLIYNDAGYVEDLHRVKPTITSPSYKLQDVLTESIIQKYSGLEFWRK